MNRLGLLLAIVALVCGCGGKRTPVDPCADVECERGVCDGASQTCANPTSCEGDSECLDGFLCTSEGCFAEHPCAGNDDCERGECTQGACVNASACEADEDCVFGYRCASGDCVADGCADVECARGVCNPETGGCANSVVCTQGTQQQDCIDGYFCYAQTCRLAEDVCEEVGCTRGVCDPETADCVDAETCGRDLDCLEGRYCDDQGQCADNQCVGATCARGKCEPATGECVNATSCARAADCLDGWSCAEGACVEAGQECGPDGCPGNQICTYVEADLIGACDESPSGCSTTFDCTGIRVCRSGACRPGPACEADALEPNDADADATRIVSQPGNIAEATLCGGEVDAYAFHTDESPLFRGVLMVDLQIEEEDLGAGTLHVELVGPSGVVATADSDGSSVRMSHEITAVNRGEYVARISDGGDVLQSGVRYSLYLGMLDESTFGACQNAQLLGGTPVSGNSNSGASFLLGSECAGGDNAAGEDVYYFALEERSWVQLLVDPAPGADLSVSLRRRCALSDDLRCVDDAAQDGAETIEGAFEAGTYFVVVQGSSPNSGGSYVLTFDAAPIVCGPDDSTCNDMTTSRACNARGTAFETVTCDDGCDAALGRCARLPTDVCYTAADATNGISTTINWADLGSDYDPGATGCVPANQGTQTDGPDAAFRIELQPDHVLVADLDLDFSDFGSLYLVENCQNIASTCVAGANADRYVDEELVYFNDTGSPQTLYLVADVETDSFGYGTAGLVVTVQQQICSPLSTQCMMDHVQACDALGTAWTDALCTFGCANGVCNPLTNDTCAGAIDLGTSGPFTGRIDEYTGGVSPSFSGCTGRSASGPDALFSVTPAVGEVATVTVDADFDVALLVGSNCSDVPGSCVVGSDQTGGMREEAQFVGDGSTYTVVVDSQFQGNGQFTIDATLQMPSCTPGDNLGCSSGTTLEYCSELGVPVHYQCASSCTANACDAPTGEVCVDAIVVTAPTSYTQDFQLSDDLNPGSGVSGACDFGTQEADGADRVYAVDLTPGDWLFVDYTSGSGLAIAYLLSDCSDGSTCLAKTSGGTSGSLSYEATTSERVYVVMDRTTSGPSSLTYDVDIDVRRQDCVPGTQPYCSDATTLSYCDTNGFTRRWACNGTCTAGACDAPSGDVCIDPIRVVDGDSVSANWSTGTNSLQPTAPIDGTCPWDSGGEADGLEDIYRIDLVAGDLLRVDLQTTWTSAYVYVLEDCLDTSTCRAVDYDGQSGTVFFYARQTGPAYVVVDSSSAFASSTSYTVSFDVLAGTSCAPSESFCDASGALQVCDASGSFIEHTYACATGCANGACGIEPAAESCATAPLLTEGIVVYGSFANLSNDVTFGTSGCTGGNGLGSDAVYAVTAGPGQVIHAEMWSWGTEQVELGIVTDCANTQSSCVAGNEDPDYNYVETYYAPQIAGTYYVVADATSSGSDEPFTLKIEVVPVECSPGSVMCSATGQSLSVCNQHGLWDDYPCDGGCTNSACAVPHGEVCYDAIPLQSGAMATGLFSGTDFLHPSGTVGTCSFASGETPAGPERYFRVDLKAGEVLEVDFSSQSSFGIIYLMSDCSDPTSCLDNTPDGTSGFLQYRAPADETVFLVVDRTASGDSTLTWDVTVDILTPDCVPGSAPTCADANTLRYCDALGFSSDYVCGGAAGTCTAGACDTPTAEACLDAIVLADGSSVSGTFEGTDDLAIGAGGAGTCNFGQSTSGIDHFYRVDLQAGEVLIADYTSASSSGVFYLMRDCLDEGSCVDNLTGSGGRIVYSASQAESVYLVIDRTTSATSTLGWTIDVTVALPNCTPGSRQCATNATTLEYCNDYGLWESFDCDGTCSNAACDMPTSDHCVDPIPLTNGSVVTDTYEGTNVSDLGTGIVGACDFGSTGQPGTDHFYSVDLAAGETLDASYTTTSGYGVLYVMSDCSQSSTCLDNTSQSSSGSVTHTATTAETVYLVMDRGLAGSEASYDYTLTVTVQ